MLVTSTIPDTTFAGRVRGRRELLGMSQAELGLASGVSQQSINNWETGRAEKTGSIVDLARALRTTPEWLQSGEDVGPAPRDLFIEMIDVLRLVRAIGSGNDVLNRIVSETISKVESAR